MIKKVVIKNFKKIEYEIFELTDFDLVVGANNSGKSTLLQALAIWQYCIEQFKRSKKKSTLSAQIILPEFTALPLPEFNLLWKDKVERKSIKHNGKTKPDYILIEIEVYWNSNEDNRLVEKKLNVQLRYQSPLSIYANLEINLEEFKYITSQIDFPHIVYIPPFSGLEPVEKWLDDGNVKQNVGKGQPGSVLRNLLFRVIDKSDTISKTKSWEEIKLKIQEWFGINIKIPEYEKGHSTQITIDYTIGKKDYDIISGGSGFHQTLTLFAFFYGYDGVTTILFDEPDAHLHTNLQRKILSYFKQKKNIQFIIATHSEEFIKGVDISSVISILSGRPKRIQTSELIIKALSDVDNIDVIKTKDSPYVLYLEGEDDERLLRAWAQILNFQEVFNKYHIIKMGGPTKIDMKNKASEHIRALREINKDVKQVILFDYDEENSYHPEADNQVVKEWKRRNIENYLLVPDAWKQAVLDALNDPVYNLFNIKYSNVIDSFFMSQGIQLVPNSTWKNINTNILQVVNGKKILFEDTNSLFQQLCNDGIKINRERIAINMTIENIHIDIVDFFNHLGQVLNN